MAYRDIDYSLRVNGDLSVPSHSLKVGSNITLTDADGKISATQFAGDGSLLANLSSSAMTDVLTLDGTRKMTSGLSVNATGAHFSFEEAGLRKWHIESASGTFKIVESGVSSRVSISAGGFTSISGSLGVAGNINTNNNISGATINATVNLQEAGVNLSAKYEPKGTLHDDRYYTETEMDTKLSGKSDSTHKHDATYSALGHAHAWGEVTGKPGSFPPSAHSHAMVDVTGLDTALAGKSDTSHTHDNRYYTETEMDTKLSTKSDTSHAHTWSNITSKPTTFPATAHSHDDRYYTETEMDTKLNSKMGYGDVVMNTNPFGGKQLFINSVNNAMFRAESRWILTGARYLVADDSVVTTLNEASLAPLFNGDYEGGVRINAGEYLKVHIDFNGGNFPGYPYGNLYMSHYYVNHSASAILRVYSNYEPHGIGWHEMAFADYMNSGANLISKARNGKYAISEMEFVIHAPATEYATITQLDWQLDRPGSVEMPIVDKFRTNSLYSDLNFRDITNTLNASITRAGAGSFASLKVNGIDVSLAGHLHDDRYYTESEMDTKLNTKSDSGHTHDDRYYTESEMNTKLAAKSDTTHAHTWSEVTGKPTTFTPSAHTHDDRYYTETEMDTKLSTKSDTGHTHLWAHLTDKPTTFTPSSHTHLWAHITDKPTSFTPSAHNHDERYYTETEMDTKLVAKSDSTHTHAWTEITAKPTTFTPSAHTHDDRYYTEIEMNTKLGDKSNVGHTHLWVDLTDKPTTFTPSVHNHDDLYYTESEMDTKLAAKSEATHLHDDRYYTETEMDTKLSGKAGSSHTHLWAHITDKPTTFTPSSHGHAISDITSLSTTLDGKASTSHAHTFASITSKPTTLSGYGITDAASSAHNHNAAYAKRGTRNESVAAIDKRTWTPADASTADKEVQFAFTALNNDSAGPYADAIIMSTYGDSSAGGNNMLLAAKDGSGLYLRYGGWDAVNWSWTKKLAFDGDKADKSVAISTGAGLSGGGDLSANRSLAVNFGTAAGTVAEGNHGHAIGNVSGLQSALDGKAATSHSHTFGSLTSRPTTLSGYGITDGATGTHKHDADYLKLSGGNLTGGLMSMADDVAIGADTGALRLGFLKKSGAAPVMGIAAGTSFKIMQSSATNLTENIAGQALSELLHVSSSSFYYKYETVYHSGNFTPADKADASTLTTHTNNAAIHKDWGNWATGGGGTDLTVSSKRALVHVTSTNKLMVNYGGDFSGGVEINGALTNGGFDVWHKGNLSLADYVSSTATGEKVKSNFTVLGRMWLGDGSGTSGTVGSLIVKGNTPIDGVQNAVQLGGATQLSNVKAFISETGAARFYGNVRMASMSIDSSALVSNLNAEYVGGVKETNFVRTATIRDIQGYGVKNGMGLVQKSPTPDMTLVVKAGIAYTDSGRRFEIEDTTVPVTTSSANYDRYDIVFIQGSKVRDTGGALIANASNEGRISIKTGLASQTPSADFAALYNDYPDAIPLGTVYVRANIGTITDGTSGTYDALDGSAKKLMSLRLIEDGSYNIAESLSTGGKITEAGKTLESKYAQLETDNLFTGNIKIRNSGGTSLTIQSDNGHSSDSNPATLYLKEDDHFDHGLKVEYLGDSNMGVISMMQSGVRTQRITISRSTGQITLKGKVVINEHLEAWKSANTVTIAAGQTTATWAHDYGSTSYAVNLTTNSFERHIRWKDKTANTITIEIDDPSSQDTLVDCILIGY